MATGQAIGPLRRDNERPALDPSHRTNISSATARRWTGAIGPADPVSWTRHHQQVGVADRQPLLLFQTFIRFGRELFIPIRSRYRPRDETVAFRFPRPGYAQQALEWMQQT